MRAVRRTVVVTLAAALAAGCGQSNTYVPPPRPKVTVANPAQQPVTRYIEATGHTVAVNSADLVARVQGFVEQIGYRDGDRVAKGTTLFTIEPETYRLKVEQAEAAESGAAATLKQTETEYQRQVELMSRNVASKAALDNALANRDAAKAKLDQAKVDTQQAKINYGYTQVKAPFDGYVTARQVSVGALVGVGQPTVLATIVSLDPIYASFDISEQDVLSVRADIARQGITPEELRKVPVEIALQNEEGFPHRGLLDYAAPSVNESTGTLAVRGIFENSKQTLLPGYFVRVRIPRGAPKTELLVPDTAVGTDQSGRYVLIVTGDNVVEQHKVTLGPLVGALRVIESGVKADDRVVVGGALRAIPGQKVEPQMQTAAASPGAAK